ncbi:craniofacial development protein 2-like [Myzus persicae]|uniref:craniofacial development protein 2-like n=1 Tax=Myzus persicae TaxID=13164 RepID=UPI000B9340EF|nr:craniofacial development protein 2-like [Myzus persicae]
MNCLFKIGKHCFWTKIKVAYLLIKTLVCGVGKVASLSSSALHWESNNNKPRTRLGKKTGNWISELKCGTWNIRTLYKPGATVKLVGEIERYKMKCVALQEVRMEEEGTTKISQTTIINGRSERGHKLGTGFAVHESIIHMIKEFKDVNPRISTLTLKDKNIHVVLINVHAPTEDKDEEIKEEFYDTLEEVVDNTVGNIKIVLGDLNAKIGKERIYHNVAGVHSLHEHSNDNGSRLANFALGKGLIIKSTMFLPKDIYKYTWVSPDGRHKNQIDHVLINNRFRNSITNVRTLRGADADSDHLLVGIWIRIKFKKQYRHKLNTVETVYNDIQGTSQKWS